MALPRTIVATAAALPLLLLVLVIGDSTSAATATATATETTTGTHERSCTFPTELAGCSLCRSYYPEASPNDAPSERGVKSPLTRHACAGDDGDTSQCCSPTTGGDHCAVWGSIYPCDDCCGDDNDQAMTSTGGDEADDGMTGQHVGTSTSTSLSSPCASLTARTAGSSGGMCSTCRSYYPDAIWSDAPSDRGDKSPLTRHACSGNDGDTSECCSPAPDGGGTCAVVYGGGPNGGMEYLYPCDDCGCDQAEEQAAGVVSASTSRGSRLSSSPVLASVFASVVGYFGIGFLVALIF